MWCCETVRLPRLLAISKLKNDEKEFMKNGRGSYEEKNTVGESVEVTYVR